MSDYFPIFKHQILSLYCKSLLFSMFHKQTCSRLTWLVGCLSLKSPGSKDIKTDIPNCQIHKYSFWRICYIFNQLVVKNDLWDPIRDSIWDLIWSDGRTAVVLKWIVWMDGFSEYLKVYLLTSNFCIVLSGLFVFFSNISNSKNTQFLLLLRMSQKPQLGRSIF